MPAPYAPAKLLVRPGEFGRVRAPEWNSATTRGVPAARLAVAYIHHQLACAVNAELSSSEWSVERLAAQMGRSVDYVGAKLRGRVPVTAEDIFSWVLIFGVHIFPETPQNAYDFLPPGQRDGAGDPG